VETSTLKLRLVELSVESFETESGAERDGPVGEQESRGAACPDDAATGDACPQSGAPTCAEVTCWETCGRTCYDTCRLTDCGY
jgi:hypothetical protein